MEEFKPKYSIRDIIDFLQPRMGVSLNEKSMLQATGIYGDDISELLEAYSAKFKVDMSGYRWYFYTGEEGFGIGGLFFKPLYRRVKEIPISVSMLCDFANQGRWAMAYPEHTLPLYRMDLLIDKIFILAVTGLAVMVLLLKWMKD